MSSSIKPAQKREPARVATNTHDWWVATHPWNADFFVGTVHGNVFRHGNQPDSLGHGNHINGDQPGKPRNLVGWNHPIDKWVRVGFRHIYVGRADGAVFRHSLVGDTIGPALPMTGPPIGARPQDNHVLLFSRPSSSEFEYLMVITIDGEATAYQIDPLGNPPDTISEFPHETDPNPAYNHRVGFNKMDRWVVNDSDMKRQEIFVITSGGDVWAHLITLPIAGGGPVKIGEPRLLNEHGPKVAIYPRDRWVTAGYYHHLSDNAPPGTLPPKALHVINDRGEVFSHALDP
jgi:hypothetical protein